MGAGVVAVAAAVCAALMCRRQRQRQSDGPGGDNATIPTDAISSAAYIGLPATPHGSFASSKSSASAGDKFQNTGEVSEASTAMEESGVDSSFMGEESAQD